MRQIERLFGTVSFAPAHGYACDVLDELARFPADVVAVDSILLGAQIGAEASGLPPRSCGTWRSREERAFPHRASACIPRVRHWDASATGAYGRS
jgi:hypothetical protein